MNRRRTPKIQAYEKQINDLTHRLGTCNIEQFHIVQAELFKVRDEYTEYLIAYDAKLNAREAAK